jgi:hypothetical protein
MTLSQSIRRALTIKPHGQWPATILKMRQVREERMRKMLEPLDRATPFRRLVNLARDAGFYSRKTGDVLLLQRLCRELEFKQDWYNHEKEAA